MSDQTPGARLRALRCLRGWEQVQLAEAAGLDQSYISLLESDKRRMSRKAIEALSKALDPTDARGTVATLLLGYPLGSNDYLAPMLLRLFRQTK